MSMSGILSTYNTVFTSSSALTTNAENSNNAATSAAAAAANGADVAVNISKEAQQAMERVEDMYNRLSILQDYLGNEGFSDSQTQTQVDAIMAKLDKLYGTNVGTTSEAMMMLDSTGRNNAAALLQNIQVLLENHTDGVALSDENSAKLADYTTQLDTLLLGSDLRPLHSFSSLSADDLANVVPQFSSLMQVLQAGGATLSDSQIQQAAEISKNIDSFMEKNAEQLPAKQMTAAEKAEANSLLDDLADIFDSENQKNVGDLVRQLQAVRMSFMQTILGGASSGTLTTDSLFAQADDSGNTLMDLMA